MMDETKVHHRLATAMLVFGLALAVGNLCLSAYLASFTRTGIDTVRSPSWSIDTIWNTLIVQPTQELLSMTEEEKKAELPPFEARSPAAVANVPVTGEFITTTTTIDSSANSIAFETESAFPLDAYSTHLQEPFTSYHCLPKRIHLSQANNVHLIPIPPNEIHFHNNQTTEWALNMTLSFMLDYQNHCNKHKVTIHYRQGFHPEKTLEASATKPLQFNYTSPINGTGLFQSDWIYHVTLPNIKAGGHRYWYRIEVHRNPKVEDNDDEYGDDVNRRKRRLGGGGGSRHQEPLEDSPLSTLLGKTPDYSFLTAPFPRTPTSIALVGDLGQTKNSTKTMAHIFHDSLPSDSNKNPTTLLLIAGDMAYADSDPLRWLSWFDLMEPLTRTVPMHVAAGNHEIECDNSTNEVFKQYEHYFYNPNRIAEADMMPITNEYRQTLWEQSCSTPSEFEGHYNYGNAFYSFQHGYVHFVVLSSYSNSTVDSPQYEWLQHELEHEFDREVTPWLIVSFHSPLYTTFRGHVNETQSVRMKESMEPLFNQYGVNLVVSGHDHGYMRTHSLAVNGTVDPTGRSPVYLTLGAAGNREMHSPGFINEKQEKWVAKRNLKDYGYAHLLVANSSHATLNWVRDGVSHDGPEEKDTWIINKHYNETTGNFSTYFYESDGTWDWPVSQQPQLSQSTS